MAEMSFFNSISIATIAILYMLQAQPAVSQEKRGVIPHAPLLKTVLPDTANLEVAVYETEYAPGGINPRHLHPAAITFYVVSGAGIWKEEGKPPVTLKAGGQLVRSSRNYPLALESQHDRSAPFPGIYRG